MNIIRSISDNRGTFTFKKYQGHLLKKEEPNRKYFDIFQDLLFLLIILKLK